MNDATVLFARFVPLALKLTGAGGAPANDQVYVRLASPPSSAPRTLKDVVLAVTVDGVAAAGEATVGGCVSDPITVTVTAGDDVTAPRLSIALATKVSWPAGTLPTTS